MRTSVALLFATLVVSSLATPEIRLCLDNASNLQTGIKECIDLGGQCYRKAGDLINSIGNTVNACRAAKKSVTDSTVCVAEASKVGDLLRQIRVALFPKLDYNLAKAEYAKLQQAIADAVEVCKNDE